MGVREGRGSAGERREGREAGAKEDGKWREGGRQRLRENGQISRGERVGEIGRAREARGEEIAAELGKRGMKGLREAGARKVGMRETEEKGLVSRQGSEDKKEGKARERG